MRSVSKSDWPEFVRKAVGGKKAVEIKEHKGRYYAYEYKSIWKSELGRPVKLSKYAGTVSGNKILPPFSPEIRGIYEYGHVRLIQFLLEENGILGPIKEIFDDWKIILAFASNRLINPQPIKSMQSWYEKTYLVKSLKETMSPKLVSRVLQTIGLRIKAQHDFFEAIKRDGEKIIYDGSVIFSSSKENPLLEIGYNKDHLLLPKVNIVMAFSYTRFFPIFFRIIPGSVHEISTINILLEELGKDIILVTDKGFSSKEVFNQADEKVKFIIPLKRDSEMIDYGKKFDSFFMFHNRPIKCASYQQGRFFVYLYEDLDLRAEEEKEYYTLLSKGKKITFHEKWAGKIALLSNLKWKPKRVYEVWKSRSEIEKAFDVLQNDLETDRPYIRKEDGFKGYLFCSFISLIAYYLILKKLKEAKLNDKISVSDLLLELSKVYKMDINGKEIICERSKKIRTYLKEMNLKNLIGN